MAPLEPSQPGLSSVEEFEEYIETHYVSMPDVMGELMEYTPEKEWETAPEYRLFPRRKKRRRKIRKTLREVDGIDLVADARHAADDGVGERLNAMAQFWHKYSHLSKRVVYN